MELPRASRRAEPGRLAAVPAVLAHPRRYEIDDAVRALAGAYAHRHLGALDAIRLATADHLATSGTSLGASVTYDVRLIRIAQEIGLATAIPGGTAPVVG